MSDPVTYQVVDGVAWLTINRPEARNALNAAVREGLWDGIRRFNDDANAQVLVLTGAGDKAFCAGGDLKEMAQGGLTVPPPDFAPQFGRNIDVAKPTIAAVNGVAFAGGFLLAQQCDLVLAAEHATFAITEVKVGRGAPWAAPLSWLVPPRIALQVLLTGDSLSAHRAHEVGLVNEVVPLGELMPTVERWASAPRSSRSGSPPTRRCRCWPQSARPICRRTTGSMRPTRAPSRSGRRCITPKTRRRGRGRFGRSGHRCGRDAERGGIDECAGR